MEGLRTFSRRQHNHGGGMSGMDMSGGMDDTGMGMFRPQAEPIGHAYWYIIAAFCGLGALGNIYTRVNARRRVRASRQDPNAKSTIPHNSISQTYATLVTMLRELSYPQPFTITRRGFQWLTPPSLGRCLMLFLYWITIVVMLTTNSITNDAYYYESLAFRAAWVTMMQIPFIVLLSMKANIVALLIGSSYERLNWLHRWVSRTVWICTTIHGGFFWTEWVKAEYVEYELEMMPIVKYGIGAWFVGLWINISGLLPLRRLCYELFVLNHLVSAAIYLWLIYVHIPEYARYYFWMAVAFVVFDRFARWAWFAVRNINVFRGRGVVSRLADRVGYRAELRVVPGETTQVTIQNVPFKWRAGQHIYLGIPAIGFFESHPFTIANTCRQTNGAMSSATLAIRAHGGFSRRLHNHALKAAEGGKAMDVRAFIQGPYGAHPTWNTFDTLILISASTGCSFTLPILEEVLQDPGCVRHLTFMLLVRHRPQCSCYMQRLREAAAQAAESGLAVRIQVVVTGAKTAGEEIDAFEGPLASRCVCGPNTPADACCCSSGGHGDDLTEKDPAGLTVRTDALEGSTSDEEAGAIIASCCGGGNNPTQPATGDIEILNPSTDRKLPLTKERTSTSSTTSDEKSRPTASINSLSTANSKGVIEFSMTRPDLADYIRYPIEQARGETCVAVCGGKSLTGYVRNTVARLSDERAVHKGTGAQGIFLHAEEFGW